MTELSDRIIELYAEGMSYRDISKTLGCSKGTIAYHVGAGQKDKVLKRNKWKRAEITKFLQEYKQSKGCMDCKENYPYWMLDFDHLGDKKFGLATYYGTTNSMELVQKEVEKCEVVCANCHRGRTHFRMTTSGEGSLDLSEFYAEEEDLIEGSIPSKGT